MSSDVELIKSKISISELIGKNVSLKAKGGGEFVGLCPFHNEKTPSFTVSENKGFYHCFGCGENGDIFTFLMKTERLEYPEALKRLAQTAGVALRSINKEQVDKINLTYKIYQSTQLFYQNCLFEKSSFAKRALSYLLDRGLNKESIIKFGIGLSPSYSALASKLSSQFKEEELLESKILNKKNSLYDIFAHRIIFPIHDRRGRVIAFGGRIIPGDSSFNKSHDENAPKYLNSSENPIFKKSYNLYGLYQSSAEIIKSDRAVVVEGYLDVISLHQFGISNAVAPLGTSLKVEHLEILSKLCKEVIVCLDGDAAGVRAMMRFTELALPDLNPSLKIRFAILPKSSDPDDYVRNNGCEKFLNVLKNAQNLADFLFEQVLKKHPMDAPESKAAFKLELYEYASKIKNHHLSKEYRYYFGQKFWDTTKQKSRRKTDIAKQEFVLQNKKIEAFDELIALVLAYPKLLAKNDVLQILLEAEISDKRIDKMRCLIIQWKDCSFDWSCSNEVLREQLAIFLKSEQSWCYELEFFVSRFCSTSLDYYNDLARKILLRYQLQLVSSDIKMLKKKLKHSGNESDFKRYDALVSLRNELKNKKEYGN